ncbi:hypothetical protein BGX30_003730 [Mortierella sp. GBA39]|nr:hypothetical protein BGX30_003730 [Mortierella sp. GBA39]
MSPRAVNHFTLAKEDGLIADATDSTTPPYFEEHECLKYARAYCAVLEEHDLEYPIRKLAIDRGQLFSPHPLDENLPKAVVTKEKVLRVLEKLLVSLRSASSIWILASYRERLPTTVAGDIWHNIKSPFPVEFGDLSDSGHKVDLIFSYGEVELSNIEFKRQDVSPKDITVQCRKSIRLGRCVQELHKSYGIKDPVV